MEFKKLIKDSRSSADYLFHALNEVKGIARVLDEKEERLRCIIKEADADFEGQRSGNSHNKKKYEDAIKMAAQGMAEKEIADKLNLAEGETSLILNLHRKKNENPVSGNILP